MLFRLSLAIFTVTLLFGRPVLAIEKNTESALHHAGVVMAIQKMCPDLTVNILGISVMLVENKADLSNPEHNEITMREARADIDAWKGKDPSAACVYGLMLYGPSGTKVPGLIRLAK